MANETQDWERRNTDPTIPFDGADPDNIPGPASNVEVEIAARKRADAYGQLSTKYRPEHAKQAAKSGDAITDSDVIANPAAGLNVGDDNGEAERKRLQEEAAGPPKEGGKPEPQGRATRQQRQTQA